jgi:hypothetical protein
MTAPALALLVLASGGCALFGIGTPKEEPEQEAAPPPVDTDPPLTEGNSKPDWMEDSGVIKADHVLGTVRNLCKDSVEFKLTVNDPNSGASCGWAKGDGSSCKHRVDPWPGDEEYIWYEHGDAMREVFNYTYGDLTGPPVAWVGHKNEWTRSDLVLELGKEYAFDVQADCKTVKFRDPGQQFHDCYQWHYSEGCGVPHVTGANSSTYENKEQPVACGDGTVLTAEGNSAGPSMCVFETPNGYCKIRSGETAKGCDRR